MSQYKLYVSNLSFDTTETALRQHFARMGTVLDVEILDERRGSSARAVVIMETEHAFDRALTLDGAELDGRPLGVSSEKRRSTGEKAPRVKVVQQYRGSNHMMYELDCAGTPLVIRLLAGATDDEWIVEARASTAADALTFPKASTSRLEALEGALAAWNAHGASTGGAPLDVPAVVEAMRSVRAV